MRCQACNRECRCPYRETREKVMVGFTRDELEGLLYHKPNADVILRLETALDLLP